MYETIRNDMSGREVWGPLVWNMFHTMASVSDRKDIYFLWNTVLRLTANVLPCDQCRLHMKQYLSTHSFIPKTWMKQTGKENALQIQKWIHTFHNAVNQRLGKPAFAFSEIPQRTRQESLNLLQEQYRQLLTLWSNQKSLLGEWRQAMNLLLNLVASGPT